MSISEIVSGSIWLMTGINLVAFFAVSQFKPEWSVFTVVKFLLVREVNIVSNLLGPGVFAVILAAVLIGGGSVIFGVGELLFHQELSLLVAFYQSTELLFVVAAGVGGMCLLISYLIASETVIQKPQFSLFTFTDPVTGKTDDVLSKF